MSNPQTGRFFAYPQAQEGPNVPYEKKNDQNPALSGWPLVIGSWLVSKTPILQRVLYSNAGFTSLRPLQELKNYDERWDPTVVPLSQSAEKPAPLDASPYPVLPDKLPGRYRSISEYHSLYLSGELTPLAVVESLLPFIQRDAKSPSHHATAWIETHIEDVLQAARESTERYKAGKPISIFDGVPTGIKDEAKVKGYRTTYGRKHHAKVLVEEASSWPVQLWEEAGGIILGKLNMHQVGADTTGNNPQWGTPLNPHNSEYYTGGSSSGSAYAVAAGLVPVALGADGGGSIRIPSSFCGLYGLKPSHHRIENTQSTVTCTGPLAASISDLTASYRLFSKPDPSDSICAVFTSPPASPNRKIGYPKTWFSRADPVVLEACEAALNYFTKTLNYELVPIDIPFLPQGQLAHAFTIISEMATRAQQSPAPNCHYLADINPSEKISLAVGSQVPAYDYALAQQLRNLLMQHLSFLYQEHPGLIILTPTSPMAGWPIGAPSHLTHGVSDVNTSIRNMEYVWLANFCGNPAISVPVGYADPVKGKGKLPIGLMAMGEWGAEEQLLGWGKEAEDYLNNVYEGGRVRPGNWEDVVELARGKMDGK